MVAVGNGAVCAFAVATKPKKPMVHNNPPICFCMCCFPHFGGVHFSCLGARFGTARIIAQFIVIPAEAGIQGNRCGLPGLDSRFRGNDEGSVEPLSLNLPGCFLPHEIIAARVTELADACGPGPVYGAADAE